MLCRSLPGGRFITSNTGLVKQSIILCLLVSLSLMICRAEDMALISLTSGTDGYSPYTTGMQSPADSLQQSAALTVPASTDSILTSSAQYLSEPADTVAKKSSRNIIQKVIDYFSESNKPRPEKKLDFSFIGGPAYSNDTKLSIGLLGAALYKSVPFDSLTPQSNSSLYSQFSITGFWLIGIKGNHIGPRDNYRIDYKVYFESFPNHFWGIGYEQESKDSNETKFLQLNSSLEAAITWQLVPRFFIGPAVRFNYTKATDIHDDNFALWNGESLRTTNYGLGFNISYDTRDFITNAYSGIFLSFEQRFYPRFMKNSYCFSSSELTFNYYHKLWKGSVVAAQAHTLLTYGNTPWGMLAKLGGSHSMRGYYEGRYRDKCAADVSIELRQHIYGRSSAVFFVGAGSVFPGFNDLRHTKILPNYGFGYRWEFKKRVNVRLDLGFGKGERGFVFNINEAF